MKFLCLHLTLLKFVVAWDMEDTDIELLNTVSGLVAKPPLFGYSQSRSYALFPPYEYPRCEDRILPDIGTLALDYETNKLSLKCQMPQSPFFVLGPLKNIKVATPELTNKLLKKHTAKNTQYKVQDTVEFAIASCTNTRGEIILNVLAPRFNATRYSTQTKKFKAINSANQKPMLLLFLAPDSFSRNHMYRKLNRTISFFNELRQGDEFSVFDFKLHNIIGADTSENQMRVFGEEWVPSFPGKQNIDYCGKTALWNKLSKLGFMTLYGTDACATNTPKSLGLNPAADHVVNLFFCSHYVHGNYRGSKKLTKRQRCIGKHMPHYYLMDYSLQFADMYSNTNLWIYNHYTAAHEGTGQHAQTLDWDLEEYLRTIFNKYNTTHEVVVIMAADHGMRYGDYKTDIESIQEHRLPGMFVVASNQLLESIPGSRSMLETNTLRLTTKPDLRETMISLPKVYFGLDSTAESDTFYNLFTENVPLSRTCEDAEIPAWYCSTYVPEIVDLDIFKPNTVLSNDDEQFKASLYLIISELMVELNSEALLSNKRFAGEVCKKMTFAFITTLSKSQSPDGTTILKLSFTIHENSDVLLDAWIAISRTPLNGILMKHVNYLSKPVILSIERLDVYSGSCETYARERKINPQFCLCRDDLSLPADT